MKRLFSAVALACWLVCGAAYGWEQSNDPTANIVTIMSGTTLVASGTSTYIIDTLSQQFGYRPTGSFSLQFKGFSVGPSPAGGATISAAWRGTNTLPTGVTQTGLLPTYQTPTSKLESTSIVSAMNILSGNTEYSYWFFWVTPYRYVLVDITSGVSATGVTAYVKVD